MVGSALLGWAGAPPRAGEPRVGSVNVIRVWATSNGAEGRVVVVAVVVDVGGFFLDLARSPSRIERRPAAAISRTGPGEDDRPPAGSEPPEQAAAVTTAAISTSARRRTDGPRDRRRVGSVTGPHARRRGRSRPPADGPPLPAGARAGLPPPGGSASRLHGPASSGSSSHWRGARHSPPA